MYVRGNVAGKLIIQLAPTGSVHLKKDTPYIPITPEEIAMDTFQAYKLGVSIVHVHARDEQGSHTHEKEIFKEIFSQIRRKCPDIIICASTGCRGIHDVEQRAEVLDLNPELASLTMGSFNFPQSPYVNSPDTIKKLATLMGERGVIPELEIFEPGFINMAQYLVRKGFLKSPAHFNLLLGSLGSIPADIKDLAYLVESLPQKSTWSATGIGRFQTQINVAAILMGGHVRVGVEDSIYYHYPQKVLATNVKLVKRIVKIAEMLGREIATPSEARTILGIPS